MNQQFSRRDFIKAVLLIPASALLTACTQRIENLVSTPLRPSPKASLTIPAPVATNTEPSQDSCSEITCPTRNLTDIKYVTIHHSEYHGRSKNRVELEERARIIELDHSDISKKPWAELYKTCKEFGFEYIAYHWLVAEDGSWLKVQDPTYERVHASDSCLGPSSHNKFGLSICLDGNLDDYDPSPEQIYAAAMIIRDWQCHYNVKLGVAGHREQQRHCEDSSKVKSCPGEKMGVSTDPESNLSRIIQIANEDI